MAVPSESEARRSELRVVLGALWSAETWLATSHLVTGAVIGQVSFLVVLTLLVLTVALAPTVVLAAGTLVLLVLANRALASVQRARFAAFLDVSIPAPPAATGSGLRRFLAELPRATTWRQLGYHLLAGVFGLAAGAMVVAAWSAGVVLAATFVYAGREDISPGAATTLTVTGLVLLFAAPWVARGLATVDAAVAGRLLGTSRSEELAHRVATLSASREGAVDAADTERRRIERDLHDGAQQRLTSLAMNLGIARTTLDDMPEPARDAIARAHDEAKLALSELRDLVRGVYPAVLDDLGLDAALSGIAARSPVPVRLRVTMPARAAREVEAVAYFVVSEALTNVTRHAGATQVDVTVARHRNRLHVTVVDDGRGGADIGRGTGLRGLANRVRSVDGTLHLQSPPGGPTTLAVELPCGS